MLSDKELELVQSYRQFGGKRHDSCDALGWTWQDYQVVWDALRKRVKAIGPSSLHNKIMHGVIDGAKNPRLNGRPLTAPWIAMDSKSGEFVCNRCSERLRSLLQAAELTSYVVVMRAFIKIHKKC